MDNAVPSANTLAAVGLLRLGTLTGNRIFVERAEAIVGHLSEAAGRVPLGFGNLLLASELTVLGTTEIVVTGDRPDLVDVVQRRWLPNAVLAWGEPTNSPLWEGRRDEGSSGRAYVCRDYVCTLPVTDPTALADGLSAGIA
jgi:uncharacterized protein YyaL (SSP411 family)